jgi:hypothetical protein
MVPGLSLLPNLVAAAFRGFTAALPASVDGIELV